MTPRNFGLALAAVLAGGAGLVGVAGPEDGVTRTYYVAADEVAWDYAPGGLDQLTGEEPRPTYRVRGIEDTVIATAMTKALYREYRDSSFGEIKERPAEWEHLGMVGPLLRGEVGDTIVVIFKNNTRYPVSMHPHGVFYDKNSEGAPYSDGTNLKHDDGVPPGETHTYVWPIPERAGPGPRQPSSIIWPYHSHTSEVADVNGGLIGAMIVAAEGSADADGVPTDVDREFVVLFGALLENRSRYFLDNLERHTGDTLTRNASGDLIRFNRFGYASLNGFLFGNLPLESMTMSEGDRVRWYLFTGTSFDDFHTPTWHGNTVLVNRRRTDVLDLGGPLLMATADMVADNPGVWQLHCHFGEHMESGMTARYQVLAVDH